MKDNKKSEIPKVMASLNDGSTNFKDRYLSMNQTADYLGISLSTIKRYIGLEDIPFHRLKRRVLFRKGEIDLWLKKRSDHEKRLVELKNLRKEIEILKREIQSMTNSKNKPNQKIKYMNTESSPVPFTKTTGTALAL